MTNKQNRPAFACNILHFSKALLLKAQIANSQDLINDEDLRPKMCSNSKGQPHIHATGVALYRCINKALNLREINNFVKDRLHLATAHTQEGSVQINIFTAREFRVKTCANFEQ